MGLVPGRDEPLGLRALLPRSSPPTTRACTRRSTSCGREPGVPYELEYGMVEPAGRVLWTVLELDRDAAGEPLVLRGTTQDVTVLRQNERRLGGGRARRGHRQLRAAPAPRLRRLVAGHLPRL